MAKMTLEELRALREKAKSDRDNKKKNIQIIIGMGTCGIAAGARVTLDAFVDALKSNNIETAIVKQTGCMGLCYVEPTVEIRVPGMPDTIYGTVSADVATQIVESHIVNKQLVSDHIFDKPAADIIG